MIIRKFQSTKTYGNERGFSCCFRQAKATHSHCSLLHGYSLGFRFRFGAQTLDDKNWVWDFGNCKWIKDFLHETFDHTLAVDMSDPNLNDLRQLEKIGLAKGASLSNCIVLNGKKILNKTGLRYKNEFVRHKVLDVIGDLYLSGYSILGHFKGEKSGHKTNNELLKKNIFR